MRNQNRAVLTAVCLLLAAMMPLSAAAEVLPDGTEIPCEIDPYDDIPPRPAPTGALLYSQSVTAAPGDPDGDGQLTVLDLIAVQRFLLGAQRLDDAAYLSADANADGVTDVFDLALLKTALLNGTTVTAQGYSVYYDMVDADWTESENFRADALAWNESRLCNAAEDYAAWLDTLTFLNADARSGLAGRFDAAFFAENRLLLGVLPSAGGSPMYRVCGVDGTGDSVRLLLGDSRTGFSPGMVSTVQLLAAALPRTMPGAEGADWDGDDNFTSLFELMSWFGDDLQPTVTEETHTSPDGQFTLRSTQSAYPAALGTNSVKFAWQEEDGRQDAGTFPLGTDFSLDWGETGVTVTLYDGTEVIQTELLPYPDRTIRHQTAEISFADKRAPELSSVTVEADCWSDLSRKISLRNMYRIDVLSSGVVGLVGVPVQLTTLGTVTGTSLTFHYSESDLRGIPEQNLIILRDDGQDSGYHKVEATADYDANTLTFTPDKDAIYLMADAYTWFGRWGTAPAELAYTADPTAYPSNWEREEDTGSIMELADKAWAVANAPDLHVSTPEELASAVYYVNALTDGGKYSITLESDIDLTGYDWSPLGWKWKNFGGWNGTSTSFTGTIDGQGHTIRGLHVPHSGMIYSTGLGTTVIRNLTLENAQTDGGNYCGIVCGQAYGTVKLENVHVTGTVHVGNASKYGALVGSGTGVTFTDCTAEVTDENGDPIPYFSASQKAAAETVVEHPVTLTAGEGTVTREESVYTNLTWCIYQNGERILERNANNEMTLDLNAISYIRAGIPTEVYLKAFIGGSYVQISKTVTVTK